MYGDFSIDSILPLFWWKFSKKQNLEGYLNINSDILSGQWI
ncbi:hypothetical protein GARC_1589 [Paraglaciecola arctica BSs20135]|uniref:Uncharacterized protein n=1 Tax=Paraglaciecola arctica BSs20135 TaxID=493475 RepID=K6Y3L9_9ALTE|nr:hypothetical protein GARC_1589 [Paraglaciecola arctica BSs20135]